MRIGIVVSATRRKGSAPHPRALLVNLLLAGLVACAPMPPPIACLLPSQRPMLVAELFFGRNIAGREPLTDAEWTQFAAWVVTPNFPAGFTVGDGDGQWQSPQTGHIARERSKVVTIAADNDADTARRLAAVIDAYRTEFRQQSVGLVTREACAAF